MPKPKKTENSHSQKVAYFSMEVGLNSKIPTYSGGLGVLAGDTLKSAADMSFGMVGVTLLAKHGYFFQNIENNKQVEEPTNWSIHDFLELQEQTVEVEIKGEIVTVGAWKYGIKGHNGFEVPLYFLTTDLEQNHGKSKTLTDFLYGDGIDYRLPQEIILGIGGVRMLEALGYNNIHKYHMNEGHAAFLTLELMRKHQDIANVKQMCVFTTHTPVPAGHDKFNIDFVKKHLEKELIAVIPESYEKEGVVNMTELALDHSDYINGVAKAHAEVSKTMYPNYPIHSITNGVHAQTWVSEHFAELFDEFIPSWRENPASLRSVKSISKQDILNTHFAGKKQIIDFANAYTNAGLDYDNFTIGWARRFTAYKRPHFLIEDPKRLLEIAEKVGPIQIIYAGKAHPKDDDGKELLEKTILISKDLKDKVKMVYLHNYDMYLAKFLTSGVDVWLNTPMPPKEASGTSGMKAALNGVPHLSVLDGWWHEGCVEGETGWSFNSEKQLYDLLEKKIIPTFYNDPAAWAEIMQKTIMLNGTYFNTHRMLSEYRNLAYKM